MPTTVHPQRSWLMWLLRMSPAVLVLAFMVGVVLMVVSLGLSEAEGWKDLIWEAGSTVVVLDGLLFVVVLWGGVYLLVVEASRGMPGLRSVDEPTMAPEPAAKFGELKMSLTRLGFRDAGWFSLDDFDETHVSAWQQGDRVAFVLYYPVSGAFRMRIVRKFSSGGILVSSTRLNDLAYPPPQGLYVQARHQASVENLWAWHLEEETLFPVGQPCEAQPIDLYVEVSSRWAGHRRHDRTWLLAVEPVEECWRMYWLSGMPLRRQFELGWTTPYWE
jgi:hypothetical protein